MILFFILNNFKKLNKIFINNIRIKITHGKIILNKLVNLIILKIKLKANIQI